MGRAYPSKSWLHPILEKRESSIHGKGLVAIQPIKMGEVVYICGGTLFSRGDIDAGKADRRTLMQVEDDLWLGDRAEDPLGDDYFLNHSCDPNLWMRDEVTLVARRDISPGEEVTMDYAMHFADPDWKMKQPCHCGSPSCRGTITGKDWTLDHVQKRYNRHFSPLINKRIVQRGKGSQRW